MNATDTWVLRPYLGRWGSPSWGPGHSGRWGRVACEQDKASGRSTCSSWAPVSRVGGRGPSERPRVGKGCPDVSVWPAMLAGGRPSPWLPGAHASARAFQFPDVVEFSETMANAGKTVIVAALDGTFQRKVRPRSGPGVGPGGRKRPGGHRCARRPAAPRAFPSQRGAPWMPASPRAQALR